jgi:hypothetical protein
MQVPIQWLFHPLRAPCPGHGPLRMPVRRFSGRGPSNPFKVPFPSPLPTISSPDPELPSIPTLASTSIPNPPPNRPTPRSDSPFVAFFYEYDHIAHPGLTSSTPTPWRLPWAGRSPTMSLARRRRPSWSVSLWPREAFSSATILGKAFSRLDCRPFHSMALFPRLVRWILEDANGRLSDFKNVTNTDRNSVPGSPGQLRSTITIANQSIQRPRPAKL